MQPGNEYIDSNNIVFINDEPHFKLTGTTYLDKLKSGMPLVRLYLEEDQSLFMKTENKLVLPSNTLDTTINNYRCSYEPCYNKQRRLKYKNMVLKKLDRKKNKKLFTRFIRNSINFKTNNVINHLPDQYITDILWTTKNRDIMDYYYEDNYTLEDLN